MLITPRAKVRLRYAVDHGGVEAAHKAASSELERRGILQKKVAGSRAISGAAKDIANTSKPSTMLRTTQITTTTNWNDVMLLSRIARRGSLFI